MSNTLSPREKGTISFIALPLISAIVFYLASVFVIQVVPLQHAFAYTFWIAAAISGGVFLIFRRLGMFEHLREGVAPLFGLMIAFAIFVVIVAPNYTHALDYSNAARQIKSVEKEHGFVPDVAAQFNSIKTWGQVVENQTFLREIALASTDDKTVLNYVMAAELVGLNSEFVSRNAMVRELDKNRLFQHIRKQAQNSSDSPNPDVSRAAALAGEM